MVKSETHRDAKILVRNPSPRLFGKKFRDRKSKNKPCKNDTSRLIKKRFRDFEILPKFSETKVFRGTIRHPLQQVLKCWQIQGEGEGRGLSSPNL